MFGLAGGWLLLIKTTMPADAELLRRYAHEHSQEAFAALVQRHLGLVYSAALRRLDGDAYLAQDVAQQVFIALAKAASELAQHPSLTGWLYTTTRNLALNSVRNEQRRQVREQTALIANTGTTTETQEPDWQALRPELDAVLDELEGDDRVALLWRFFEERTYAQIARLLEVQEDAARMRVNRALDKLRERLGQRGITSTSAALGSLLTKQAVGATPEGLAGEICTAVKIVVPKMTVAAGMGWLAISGVVCVVALMLGLAGGWWAEHQVGLGLRAELQSARSETARLEGDKARLEASGRRAEMDLMEMEKLVSAYVAAEAQRRAAAEVKAAPAEAVPEVSVSGQIRNAGRYPLTKGMSIGQLIDSAGGVTESAKRNHITVSRRANNGARSVFRVDLDRVVEAADGIQSPLMVLQAGDLVFVPEGLR